MLIASCRRILQTTIKDFFRTILTRVAGLGLEPQTIEVEPEAEAGKKRRGRRGRDRGRGRGRNPAADPVSQVTHTGSRAGDLFPTLGAPLRFDKFFLD